MAGDLCKKLSGGTSSLGGGALSLGGGGRPWYFMVDACPTPASSYIQDGIRK